MPIRKMNEFVSRLVDGKVMLSAAEDSDGTVDGIKEMSVHYVEMQPGDEVSPHVHNRVEVYVFLTGRAEVLAGDDLREVTTGDVAFAPTGTPHAIRVIGNEPLRFYALNSPPASSCPLHPASEDVLWRWKRRV